MGKTAGKRKDGQGALQVIRERWRESEPTQRMGGCKEIFRRQLNNYFSMQLQINVHFHWKPLCLLLWASEFQNQTSNITCFIAFRFSYYKNSREEWRKKQEGCILTSNYIANLWNWQIGVYSGKHASCQWHLAINVEMLFPAWKELRISLQRFEEKNWHSLLSIAVYSQSKLCINVDRGRKCALKVHLPILIFNSPHQS